MIGENLPPVPPSGLGAASTVVLPYVMHLFGYLPSFMALMGAVLGTLWYSIMICESKTTQAWYARWRTRRKERTVTRLQARIKAYELELRQLDNARAARILNELENLKSSQED